MYFGYVLGIDRIGTSSFGNLIFWVFLDICLSSGLVRTNKPSLGFFLGFGYDTTHDLEYRKTKSIWCSCRVHIGFWISFYGVDFGSNFWIRFICRETKKNILATTFTKLFTKSMSHHFLWKHRGLVFKV